MGQLSQIGAGTALNKDGSSTLSVRVPGGGRSAIAMVRCTPAFNDDAIARIPRPRLPLLHFPLNLSEHFLPNIQCLLTVRYHASSFCCRCKIFFVDNERMIDKN